MQPLQGSPSSSTNEANLLRSADNRPATVTSSQPSTVVNSSTKASLANLPLTLAQRTALERLVTQLAAFNQSKTIDIWTAVRQQIGLKPDTPLNADHFLALENALQGRLLTVQNQQSKSSSSNSSALLKQLTELLPQGNNRQLISQIVRQLFGHATLTQLNADQLQQVITQLQSANTKHAQSPSFATSSPTLSNPVIALQPSVSERTLSPAELHVLQQIITQLSSLIQKPAPAIWQTILQLSGATQPQHLPASQLPAVSEFVQLQMAVSQEERPTLNFVLTHLKQPINHTEQQVLRDYCLQRFQAEPTTVLTQHQATELVTFILSQRLTRLMIEEETLQSQGRYQGNTLSPQPIYAAIPALLQPLREQPALGVAVIIIIAVLLFAILV